MLILLRTNVIFCAKTNLRRVQFLTGRRAMTSFFVLGQSPSLPYASRRLWTDRQTDDGHVAISHVCAMQAMRRKIDSQIANISSICITANSGVHASFNRIHRLAPACTPSIARGSLSVCCAILLLLLLLVIDMNQLTAVTSRRRHVTQIYISTEHRYHRRSRVRP